MKKIFLLFLLSLVAFGLLTFALHHLAGFELNYSLFVAFFTSALGFIQQYKHQQKALPKNK